MNLDSKSPRKELRRSLPRFQQKHFSFRVLQNDPRSYFFFLFAAALAGFAAALCAALASGAFPLGLPCIFISASCALSEPFAPFFSLLFGSFCFGGSLIPESFRRVFSLSSGVLPLPFNCSANICSITTSNFGPSGIPIRFNSSRTVAIPPRSGRHLFKYAFILESAAEFRVSASR